MMGGRSCSACARRVREGTRDKQRQRNRRGRREARKERRCALSGRRERRTSLYLVGLEGRGVEGERRGELGKEPGVEEAECAHMGGKMRMGKEKIGENEGQHGPRVASYMTRAWYKFAAL